MSQPTVSSFFQTRKKATGQISKLKSGDTSNVTHDKIALIKKLEATPEQRKRSVSVERSSKKDAFIKYIESEEATNTQVEQAKQRASSCSRIASRDNAIAKKKDDLTSIKKSAKSTNVSFLKHGNLSPHKARSPFKLEKRSVLSPKRLEAIDALVSGALASTKSGSLSSVQSPLKTPEKKASPADIKKRLGSTNSLATLQARLKGLSESPSHPTARKALFVDETLSKPSSPALSRKGLNIAVEVSKPIIPASPVKASPRKQVLVEAEKVDDKTKDLLQPSEDLPLPKEYSELASCFRKLDELVAIKFNRNQAISVRAIKDDVQNAMRKRLTDDQLQQIRCVLPTAYDFTWEAKKDSRGRPTPDYELHLTPNLSDNPTQPKVERMSPRDLVERQKLFNHCLLTIVQDHHQAFLKGQKIALDNSQIHRWYKDFDVNAYCPSIDQLAYPTKPHVESPERDPQAMLAKITGLNQSVEKALKRVVDITPVKPEPMTPVSKAVEDEIKLDPALRDLPPHLLAKIKAQERDRRIREMTMDKTKQKEIAMLEELLHKRVCFFLSIT